MNSYAALWCKSNFSFLEGASHPDELVEEAHRRGLHALALTDRDGVYGVIKAHVKARELGIRVVLGAQITIFDGSVIVLLAQDRTGWGNLCELITSGRTRSQKGECSVSWAEVCDRASGILALWGGARSLLASQQEPTKVAIQLRDAFGDRLYALCARHRRPEELQQESRLRRRALYHSLPLVAANEVLYHSATRRPLQDVLTCIREGTAVSRAGTLLRSNAEHDLKSRVEFASLFDDDEAAVARTREVAERCCFTLDEIRYRYPSENLPDGQTSSQRLRHLVERGAYERYHGEVPDRARAQLDKELTIIDELEYCGYFLTMYEIVEFCNKRAILCQGRGSAANSLVCFCLGITAVDPVKGGLLFERFLSRERAEPPDIDLDIEHERREEVIQHVYAKYRRTHAAMVANVIRYRARSAVREVGKTLAFPETKLARLTRLLSYSERAGARFLRDAGFDPGARETRLLGELSSAILGFPRHLSIHPGGFLLGHDRVSTLVPIEKATKEDRTVIQWDKDDIEAVGLFKVDLLGLGALSHLRRCFDLLRAHYGVNCSIADIESDEEDTFDMICAADTVGVFQIESRAQMAMLPRLKPRKYYDLVIEVSIVRPGPIAGGMVHPYLRRRRREEEVDYPHECLRPVLERTLGVPLFQEQVMKLAIEAADYTPGEADQLRRDMAAWRKNGKIEQHHERIVTRMQQKGIAREYAERVFQQIRGFGEYGFPESHATSFALISYAGAWLKCHYPAVFTCALVNSQPMGFYSVSTIVDDAIRHGVDVRSVDVTRSSWDCTLEPDAQGFAIRMGLRTVKGMRESDWRRIETARARSCFSSIEDFRARTRLGENALTRLAQAGAFEVLGHARRSALWATLAVARVEAAGLFGLAEPTVEFEPLSRSQEIARDYEHMGHSTRGHPLAACRDELLRQQLPDAKSVRAMRHGERVRYAGLVICRQHPATASGVTFMTLEDETGFVNVVLWKRIFERYSRLAKTQGFLGVSGVIQTDQNIVHVVAQSLWVPREGPLLPEVQSYDFH